MNGCHKHQPAPPLAVTAHLAAMGESLATACTDLALEPSIGRCDALAHKLKGASQAVNQFRRGLVAGGSDERP